MHIEFGNFTMSFGCSGFCLHTMGWDTIRCIVRAMYGVQLKGGRDMEEADRG